jgi:hypothetical protein
MFSTVDQCMAAPTSEVAKKAKSQGVKHITLDTRQGKLSVCESISLHQQPMINKHGAVNPLFQKTLKKQEQECGLCKV